jgi:hypothetical protein
LYNFTSIQSGSPRPDKQVIRQLYPQNEQDLNENAPHIRDAYSSPIFWDKD